MIMNLAVTNKNFFRTMSMNHLQTMTVDFSFFPSRRTAGINREFLFAFYSTREKEDERVIAADGRPVMNGRLLFFFSLFLHRSKEKKGKRERERERKRCMSMNAKELSELDLKLEK